MNKKSLAASVLLQLTFSIACASDMAWPKLVNGKSLPECKTALRLAQTAYKSTAFNLWEPQDLPDDLEDTLVVGPQGIDLSGGDALDVDLEVFTKVALPDYASRSVYWQTEPPPHQSNRLVIEEQPHGWRGDAYAVRLIPSNLTTSEYFSATNIQGGTGITTLIDGAWRAPLVFQSQNTEKLWMVYVGEPYVFSPTWVVYLPVAGQLQDVCNIQFRPNVKHATSLLPNPVRRLATLLDQSIGRGENEGTLQPTARIRIEVEQAWANAALRPWAMGEPYNSREVVDAGLLKWADQGKAYRTAYAEIQSQYKIAEKALAAFYVSHLHMSMGESKSTAARVLDSVFRSHYAFPESYESRLQSH